LQEQVVEEKRASHASRCVSGTPPQPESSSDHETPDIQKIRYVIHLLPQLVEEEHVIDD